MGTITNNTHENDNLIGWWFFCRVRGEEGSRTIRTDSYIFLKEMKSEFNN